MGRTVTRGKLTALAAIAVGCGLASAASGESAPSPAQEGSSSLLRGNVDQAITQYTDALKDPTLTNDRRGAVLGDRAVAYARSGQTRLALDDFNRAVQLFPEHPATYNNRGNLLLALGLAREAIHDFDRAILLAPGYAAAYANRAGANDKLGQSADAMRDYTRAVELMPANAVPLAGRGRVLLALGKPHAAIRDFTRAVNADARFANGYRGRALAKLKIGRYEDAIEDLSRAVAFDNGNAEIYILRGHAYLGASNFTSAIRDFSRAIELDAKSASAYAGRGLVNGYVQAFDEAFADLNRAIEIDPRNPVAFSYRAIVYNEAGQTDVGLKDVETAMKLDPERAEAFWARGAIAEAQGRTGDALVDYRRAVSGNSTLALAAQALKRAGGELPDSADVPVAGQGIPGWSVVTRGTDYFAVNTNEPGLRVPLESPGTGQPQLIAWEVKKPPLSGIGVLRFKGGSVAAGTGTEEVDLSAIVDINGHAVIAVEPDRIGSRTATWTWDEGKVTVASVDGVTDEFLLRTSVAVSESGSRVRSADGRRDASRDPDQLPFGPADRPRVERDRPQRSAGGGGGGGGGGSRPGKPKSIFDLLFGN